jgi:hypothetical protein
MAQPAGGWDQLLTAQHTVEILRTFYLFTFKEHNLDKLCFSPTEIYLESGSGFLRTGAEYYHTVQKVIGTDPQISRGLETLSLIVRKVQDCLRQREVGSHYFVVDGLGRSHAWIDLLKGAKEGLSSLQTHQYSKDAKKTAIIQQALDTLIATETIFGKPAGELPGLTQRVMGEDLEIIKRALREKEDVIGRLTQQVAMNAAAQESMQRALKEKEEENTRLTQQITANAGIQATILEKDAEIARLKEQIAAAATDKFMTALLEKDAEIARLKQQIAATAPAK